MTTENGQDLIPLPVHENKNAQDCAFQSQNIINKSPKNLQLLEDSNYDEDETEFNFIHIEKDCISNKLNGKNDENSIKEMINHSKKIIKKEFEKIESICNSEQNPLRNLETYDLEVIKPFKNCKSKILKTIHDYEMPEFYEKDNENIKLKLNNNECFNHLKTNCNEKSHDEFIKKTESSIEGNKINKFKFNAPFKEEKIGKNLYGNNFKENDRLPDESFNQYFFNNGKDFPQNNFRNGDNNSENNFKPNINNDNNTNQNYNIIDLSETEYSTSLNENCFKNFNQHKFNSLIFNDNKLENLPISSSLYKNDSMEISKACEDNLEYFFTEITEDIVNMAVELINVKEEKAKEDYNSEEEIEDEDDIIIPRVRRSSSLKTTKTPPGTPSRKKIVRFADVLGLDLANVRTFLDDIPKIPNCAYKDLEHANMDISVCSKSLLVLFQQPGGQTNFLDKVRINNVMLENAIVENHPHLVIRGLIRVLNLDYHKLVFIRYTTDSWKSFSDLQATYVEGSFDGISDKFSFLLHASMLNIGQRMEFAVRFRCGQKEYWDNNNGGNYCLQCMPVAHPVNYAETSILDDQIATFCYKGNDVDLKSSTVQDFIMRSLETTEKQKLTQASKPEIFSIFLFVVFSIILLYVKKYLFHN